MLSKTGGCNAVPVILIFKSLCYKTVCMNLQEDTVKNCRKHPYIGICFSLCIAQECLQTDIIITELLIEHFLIPNL